MENQVLIVPAAALIAMALLAMRFASLGVPSTTQPDAFPLWIAQWQTKNQTALSRKGL